MIIYRAVEPQRSALDHTAGEGGLAHSVEWHCPGCNTLHCVPIKGSATQGGQRWTWNDRIGRPILSPSVHFKDPPVCHSFVQEGKIQFLSDCGHALAGQTVPMIDEEKPLQ